MDDESVPGVAHVHAALIAHPSEILRREERTPTSVRVVGTLVTLDHEHKTAIIQHRQASLDIDTSLLDEQFGMRVGDALQVIGELVYPEDATRPPTLRARLARNVNSLPMAAYEQSVECLREFMKEVASE